jgi:hypothetical protein
MFRRLLLAILLPLSTAACLFGGSDVGSLCDDYCDRMEDTCPTTFEDALGGDFDSCVQTCSSYRNDPDVEDENFATAGNDNTLECRLKHSEFAANDGRADNDHCGHSGPDGAGEPGSNGNSAEGVCTSPCFLYCELFVDPPDALGEACTGANQFDSADECAELCDELSQDAARSLHSDAAAAAAEEDTAACEEALPPNLE